VQVLRYEKLLRANSIAKTEFENVSLQYQTSQTNYQNAWENYKQLKQQAEQTLVVNESQKDVNSVVSSFNQIRAITACKIYQKLKQKGDFVRKGDAIARIGDATFVYAKVNVDEGNIEKIKIGQEATIQLNTNKSKLYKGKVAEISPTFNEASQSFMCKIVFAETLDFKIVQTQLQTNIKVGELKNALLIPRNYLGYGDIVQVKGKEKPVKVTPRIISSEWVQVESGIDENNTIITDNL
jgi:multidrug efflux pump subunit AcrA (membrane-fusion protein)